MSEDARKMAAATKAYNAAEQAWCEATRASWKAGQALHRYREHIRALVPTPGQPPPLSFTGWLLSKHIARAEAGRHLVIYQTLGDDLSEATVLPIDWELRHITEQQAIEAACD
jgi:hypothetical protein